ncbi:type II toxin-antitoxin system RelE family toxin [Desulfurobacterium atlanticum]|uniref:mRNA interferase RelE/StbE n=1 Tax=Desulfurobacterium atlanticum TaxID=240169 RepID=A0A238YE62_9BACT|nr:type II toxin-antitoxin system RelE/ParE family toxin [Desulfurobacterium atlanticum]SNR68893.1 mRNA interferase RelE/StbE [Desulfurobacterium atlanticum]
MYKLLFSEVAKKDLEKFTIDERIFIAEKLKYLAENFELLKQTKKVRKLKGSGKFYRFVIARKIRAIFEVKNEEIVILMLRVGKRKDVYRDL